MKLRWFKQNGFLFIPVNSIGWIIALAAFAFAVYSFIEIDSQSHSVSDTLRNFVFRLILIFAAYSLIGYFTSKKK